MHPSSLLHSLKWLLSGLLLASLMACSTVDHGKAPSLERGASWVVLPFANHTETPLAGNRAEAVALALLQAQNIGTVQRYPGHVQQESLFDGSENKRQEEALAWAREQNLRYALTGAVDEWRYKVGVDGEPAAGVTLQIIEVSSGQTLWSGAGGKSGWSREALSSVAQKLIRQLLRAGLASTR
ncbi:MAG: penicillin-binding protein activator LpoB [Giesbergeria sp.]|uniref:penicillin-binding protein activator LpoB n=1 Tax=Giesbergeria sp. TaxID=2818473 RepID=UPI002609B5AD|nr:penicillin-binding protein activator LpoB [Giesbergeria sp.]MDD2608745.1 penicillin-binding protein activator LpoB [Giesbergeria sp.]